jgi:hypothetical protein
LEEETAIDAKPAGRKDTQPYVPLSLGATSKYAARLLLSNRRKGPFIPLIPRLDARDSGRERRMYAVEIAAVENCSGHSLSAEKRLRIL